MLAHSTERQPSIKRLTQVINGRNQKLNKSKIDSGLSEKFRSGASYLPSQENKVKPGIASFQTQEQNNEDIIALLSPAQK